MPHLLVYITLVVALIFTPGILAAELELPRLINEYRADEKSLERAWNLPWSEAQQNRLRHHVEQWQRRLEAVPFGSLERGDQVDWLLLRNHLQKEVASLNQE